VLVTSERLAGGPQPPGLDPRLRRTGAYKSPVYALDPLRTPMSDIAPKAFAMARLTPGDVDMVSIYDCYTITALLTLEDAGFCEKGKGMQFVSGHDLTFRGDFPMNTAGGQLGYGQPGNAGGMHHVCDATRQLMGRAGDPGARLQPGVRLRQRRRPQ
jgi:acetyl-CoA acetyltransferase